MLGPSGTGKSVFLKTLVGLLKPDRGSIFIRDVNLAQCSEHQLYETRKLFGVLFQDGALFGSMNLYDNIAFPLREHTRKSESEIKQIVLEKLDMVGLERHREEAAGRDLRRHAQASRPGPRAGARSRDHPVRRAGFRSGSGPGGLHQPAHRRPERPDRLDLPDRHPRHRYRPNRAGQPRPAVPPGTGHVRPARGAADLGGGGGQAVPERPPRGPDRHVGGEGRRPGRGRTGLAGRRQPAQPWRPKGGAVEGVPPQLQAIARTARAQGRRPPPAAGDGHAAHAARNRAAGRIRESLRTDTRLGRGGTQ